MVSSSKSNPEKGRQYKLSLVMPLAFISLALLCCQVGYIIPHVSRAFGGMLWLLLVYFAAGKKRLLWLALSAILLFNPYGAVHRPEGLWLLALLPWAGGRWGRRWMGAALIVAIGGWIWTNNPAWWVSVDEFAASLSMKLSGSNLSTAAAGLPLLAIAICFPLASILSEKRVRGPVIAISGLVLVALLYVWQYEILIPYLHRWGIHGFFDAFNLQGALLILLGLVLALWGSIDPPRKIEASGRSVLLIPALILAGSVLVGWPAKVNQPRMEREVVFYNQGYLNWDIPKYGYYGRGSSGMFGLAPDYLRWSGFKTSLADTLTEELLKTTGVLVIINLIDPLTTEQEKAVHHFVENGGSLLLLGDHTGLANIREPSNQLLQPYGIELNFDSAKPKRTGWDGELVTTQHPLTQNIGLIRNGGDSPGVTQIWVGASLQVQPPAYPLIVGRDGFSDIGDESNEKDGFLGDFRYRTNERLGNLDLLAEARVGKGKVLVFGDTSTLQNGALVRSGAFTRRIFSYLLADVKDTNTAVKTAGVIFLVAAVVVWMLSGGSTAGLVMGALTLFIAAGFCQHKQAAVWNDLKPEWTEDAFPRAIIDHAHSPRAPLNQTGGSGTWGLQNCLMRSRFLPQAMENWNFEVVKDAAILLELAPAKKFSKEERSALAGFMQSGGEVILCCGKEEFDGSRSLLQDYGLEPVYTPLGPAEVETTILLPTEGDTIAAEKQITVHFHKAWEIKVTNPDAEVLLEYEERPVVVYVPVEEGGLLYIADTDFLLNRNLEAPSGEYQEENILYLRWLLRKLVGEK